MNLKLKRTTRTPYSEEIAIYDAETLDENEQPVNIGKMDVHYIDDQVVGTLLIWQEYATGYNRAHPGSADAIDGIIDAILAEVSEPVGVSGTYAIEVFYPSSSSQGFFSNYPDEDETEEAQVPPQNVRSSSLQAAQAAYQGLGQPPQAEGTGEDLTTPEGDDFAEQLRSRG